MNNINIKKVIVEILIVLNVYFVGSNMKSFASALLVIPLCLLCTYLPFMDKEKC